MTAAPAARYRPLGAFRFGLALLVVLQHFQHLLPPEQRVFLSHMGFGAIAVCVFFAVSGFVVAEANATFYAGRPGAFLANRAVRLAPPYFATLALSVLVHAVLWNSGKLVLWDYDLTGSPLAPARLARGVLGLMPGFSPHRLGEDFEFIPFVWTLRLEVAFYIAAACAMAAAVKARAPWPVGAAMCAGLLVSALFLLLAHRPGILSTAPMFLVGSALFLLDTRPGWRHGALLAVSVCVAAAGFASWRQHGAPVLMWQLSVLAGLLALFAWLVTRDGDFRWLDKRLGNLSYPLYLNHYVVGILANSLIGWLDWRVFAGACVAAVLLAMAAESVIDKPLRGLRDRIRARAL
jgi:peptidoglycan/LPS O-acetylase OafA/YrhL